MATSMDPPTTTFNTAISAGDPPASSICSTGDDETLTLTTTTNPSTGSPPPENPNNPPIPEPSEAQKPDEIEAFPTSDELPTDSDAGRRSRESQSQNTSVPYSIPQWSEAPSLPFSLEVLKDGFIIDHLDVTKKGAYMFGRIDLCDFVLEHPTISRFHAVLQFKGSEEAYLYDLGSTHGTFINKNQVKKKVYVQLHVGDVIRFGLSSRLYVFQGPTELMPEEADLKNIYYAKDREASLRRARKEAALADGASWGMREDAIEEDEEDLDEVTWQNYKGELTEKQQKTREKVLKRLEKIAHMKKEISAIRAKDISQGGLTQGQQTQIARNEMRISEIAEELESLEETLNDSIRESLGARTGKSHGRQRGVNEDEDDYLSDDDEFYDRTKKKATNKSADTQAVETADSLLDKKEALLREMEEKRKLILEEKNKVSESVSDQDAADALDAFMTGLSSQLVIDKTVQLEKDLSSLQTELNRITYLLKIADPTGEAAKKREREPKSNELKSSASTIKGPQKPKSEPKKVNRPEKLVSSSTTKQATPVVSEEANDEQKATVDTTDQTGSKPTVYQVAKPQWLGAVEDKERKEKESKQEGELNTEEEAEEFVDYKDRQKILDSSKSQLESDLEKAAPGLILRKKKQVEKNELREDGKPSMPEPPAAHMMAEDAVALLLKHKRGLFASDEEAFSESNERREQQQSGQDNKRPRRVLGPEKPAFLETPTDYETWVPPEGQSGDGRTSLNDRFGY